MANDEIAVLLVEDDPQDAQLTLRVLHSENVPGRIEVARDGEEALDFIFCREAYRGRSPEQMPKLILLDLKLPKVDGMQVLMQVKASPEYRSIPVVVLTSSAEQRDLVDSYNLGVNSYIQKPVDIIQFRDAIKAVRLYWLNMNRLPADKNSAARQK